MNFKKVISYTIFLVIGIILLYWQCSGLSVEQKVELGESLRHPPLLAMGITFFMGLLAVISRGIRWNLLLEPMGYKASVKNSISSVALGYLANIMIPRSGELARCTALHSTDHIPIDKLFGTVIIERIIDFVMLFLFLSIALISNFNSVVKFFSVIKLPGGSPLVMLILALGVLFIGLLVIIKRKSASKGKNSIYSKILNFIRGIIDGIKSIKSMERRAAFLAHTFFIWLMYFFMSYFVFVSLVKEIKFFQGLWVMVSGGFGMVFPSPNGIGSYHLAVEAGFESIGFTDKALNTAVAWIIWTTQTIMLILSGIIGSILIQRARIEYSKT